MRIAWFSPLPPSTSGIAAYSAETVPLLAARGVNVDTYCETDAHEFVWRRRRKAYDLTVFQMGNAACHDFMWGYLFRYPGMLVLHDAQLHQARALHLTKRWSPRRDDYLAEFRANHPEAPEHLGQLVATGGMSGTLFQHWPFLSLAIASARMTVVHNAQVAEDLRSAHPAARIDAIEMGVADPMADMDAAARRLAAAGIRQRLEIPCAAFVVGAFGGVTREKRIPEVLRAMSTSAEARPDVHLMVVGRCAPDYDVMADARAWRVADRVHVTGFVSDRELAHYMWAADVCACLRWPTNRETSASWLRCLAAQRPTLISDLTHLGHVPAYDPRGWRVQSARPGTAPVAVCIDLLDENHSLQLALERLSIDAPLRRELGTAARGWWQAHHQMAPMADAYCRLLPEAAATAPAGAALPPHLRDDGSGMVRTLLEDLGMPEMSRDLLSL